MVSIYLFLFLSTFFKSTSFILDYWYGYLRLFFEEPLINKFQTGIRSVTKFYQHQVNACNYFTRRNFDKTSRTLIIFTKVWLNTNLIWKVELLELYILDFLSSTRIGVFAKSIEITLSIFTISSDFLANRIKMKSYQMKSHDS